MARSQGVSADAVRETESSSVISWRRLPRPVSESVTASVRVSSNSFLFSRKVMRETRDDQSDGRHREHQGDRVEPGEVVQDEHTDRDRDARGGNDRSDRPSASTARWLRWLTQAAFASNTIDSGPRRVEQRSADIRVRRDLIEVDAVGGRHHRETRAEQQPRPTGPPVRQRERTDDERQKQCVTERIREVGGDGREIAARGRENRLQDDRCAERADSQTGGDPVEPHARGQLRNPDADRGG